MSNPSKVKTPVMLICYHCSKILTKFILGKTDSSDHGTYGKHRDLFFYENHGHIDHFFFSLVDSHTGVDFKWK